MRRNRTILSSIAVAVPLVAAIGVKTVSGSEPPGRLVVNGDGTVTDSVTKLVWQQVTGSTACASISLGAFTTGWRTPAVKELVSIVDYESSTAPMIDTTAFPGTSGNYTTATAPATGGGIIIVSFTDGTINSTHGGSTLRCVHSPAP